MSSMPVGLYLSQSMELFGMACFAKLLRPRAGVDVAPEFMGALRVLCARVYVSERTKRSAFCAHSRKIYT
jgi:hypothetical protein